MNVSDLAKILGIDKKGDQKITFKKGNFSPEKIGVTPVFNRMFYNANFKQEITRINNDIKSAFKNLIKMGVHKNEIPLVSASLFNQLMVTIDRGNLSFIKNDSAPEFTRKELKKISDIQYKIYKVLFKIEEDLIDEQDTSIKGQEKNSQEFLANLKKLLDEPEQLKPRMKYPLNSFPKIGEVPEGRRGMTKAEARTSERNGRVTRLA